MANHAAADASFLTQEEPPYPRRDAARERSMLYPIAALSFDALNHAGWGGRRDLREGARILVAGVGNGDAVVVLAEQARGTSCEIVMTDASPTALALTKARLAQRGLSHVVQHPLDLLDLSAAALGEFDVIVCHNVLHYAADIDAVLAAVAALLKADGILAISVHATYGRLGLHPIQVLMRYLIEDYMPRELKVKVVRELLASLHGNHWLAFNGQAMLQELDLPDGSGIAELLLRPVDHTFTVIELYQWLDRHGLNLTCFTGEAGTVRHYQPETHTQSPILRSIVADKPGYEREAIGELMYGDMRVHQLYAAFEEKVPAVFAADMVITRSAPAASVAPSAHRDGLLGLIDGRRSIGEIVQIAAQKTGTAADVLMAELEMLYRELHQRHGAFLRAASMAPYITWGQIQDRLVSIPAIVHQ